MTNHTLHTKNRLIKSKLPLVSILVVTYNNLKFTKKALQSIVKQTYPNIETIVIDNNSSDNTAQFIKKTYPTFKLIENKENLFFAKANNIGFMKSKGDFILLLNNDAFLESTAISEMVKYMQKHPDVGSIQNKLLLAEEPTKIDSAGSFFSVFGFLLHRHYNASSDETKPIEIFAGKGASLMIRRSALLPKKYLFHDKYMLYFEDTDLCWRILLNGYKNIYLPGPITYHYVGKTSNRIKRNYFIDYHSFKNRLSSIIINSGYLFLFTILPIHIIILLILMAIYAVIAPGLSKAIFLACRYNLKNLRNLLYLRKEIQAKRKISDFRLLHLIKFQSPRRIIQFIKLYTSKKV